MEIYAGASIQPEWCVADDQVTFSYCAGGSYQLCADTYGCPPPPAVFSLVPPWDNGDFGAVGPLTGVWTWAGSTVQPGDYDIEFQVSGGPSNFHLYVTVTDQGCDCCAGRVGNANGVGGDEPTIGDISTLIDHLFISGAILPCYEEADVNQSGGTYPTTDDITIGDVSTLIDYLFITGPPLGLPDCL